MPVQIRVHVSEERNMEPKRSEELGGLKEQVQRD